MSFPKYKKYKDSGVEWLGEVPEGWEVVPLKYFCRITTGFAFKSESFADDGVPLIRIGDILSSGKIDLSKAKYLPVDFLEKHKEAAVRKSDILMAMTGATIGKAARYLCNELSLLNQRVCAFRASQTESQPFLWYVLTSKLYIEHISITAFGGAQPNISDSELLTCSFPLPPPPEQTNIAKFLDRETSKIDDLVAEQRRLMKLLKEKRQAVISDAVTKGIVNEEFGIKNEHLSTPGRPVYTTHQSPLVPSGVEWLGDVPEGWRVLPLKYFCRITTGFAFKSESFADDGIPLIRIGDILSSGKIDLSKAKYLPVDFLEEHKETAVRQNDILMAMTGATIGKAARYLCNELSLLNQRVCAFRASQSESQPFLWYVLTSKFYIEHISITAFGGAQPNISDSELLTCSFHLPPLQEQTQIAKFLDSETQKIDILITESQFAINLLQERRTALISAAVTGQIDVRELY